MPKQFVKNQERPVKTRNWGRGQGAGRGRLTDREYKEDEALPYSKESSGQDTNPSVNAGSSLLSVTCRKPAAHCVYNCSGIRVIRSNTCSRGTVGVPQWQPILADVPMDMSLSQERRQQTGSMTLVRGLAIDLPCIEELQCAGHWAKQSRNLCCLILQPCYEETAILLVRRMKLREVK